MLSDLYLSIENREIEKGISLGVRHGELSMKKIFLSIVFVSEGGVGGHRTMKIKLQLQVHRMNIKPRGWLHQFSFRPALF